MNTSKQFGIWMDTQHAIIVGNSDTAGGAFAVVADVNGAELSPNSSEKNFNNEERTLKTKYFKQIATYLQNATEVHVTGTGQVQEQFIHYLADTPQFKNTATSESTSNKMSEENLVKFITEKLTPMAQ